MRIFIDKIDPCEPESLGFTKAIGYPIHFRSSMFQGWAKFVPAGENPEDYVNREIDVELAHESIGGLHVSTNRHCQVLPLVDAFSYHVRGEIKAIVHHSEPAGNRTAYIAAGDAEFSLRMKDLGDLNINKGELVEFNVYRLSLWDESI